MKKILGGVIGVISLANAAPAAVTTYSDLAAYSAATGPATVFDFNSTPNGSFDGTSYDVGPFTLTGDSTGSFSNLMVSGGQVNANVCGSALCGSAFGYSLIFDAPIYAFGADFSAAAGGSRLTFTVDGIDFAGPTANNGFFGFLSTSAFTTLTVSGGDEVHNFDNVRFSAAVPEPATWAMLIGGFGLIGGAMRRRQKVNVSFA